MGIHGRRVRKWMATPAMLLLAAGTAGSASTDGAGFAVAGAALNGECRASMSPKEVSPARSPVTVRAAFTEELGVVKEAEVEEKSGIEVLSIEPHPPEEAEVTLVTRDGSGGEWRITFRGEDGTECVGHLVVSSDESSVWR